MLLQELLCRSFYIIKWVFDSYSGFWKKRDFLTPPDVWFWWSEGSFFLSRIFVLRSMCLIISMWNQKKKWHLEFGAYLLSSRTGCCCTVLHRIGDGRIFYKSYTRVMVYTQAHLARPEPPSTIAYLFLFNRSKPFNTASCYTGKSFVRAFY